MTLKANTVKFDQIPTASGEPAAPQVGEHWYNPVTDRMQKRLAGPGGTGVTRTYMCEEQVPVVIPEPLVAYNGYEHGFSQNQGGFAPDGSTSSVYRGTPVFTATWRCANDAWLQYNPQIWMDWDNPKGGQFRSDNDGNTKLRLHAFRHPTHQNGINHNGFDHFAGDTKFPIDSEWGPVGAEPYNNAITFTPNLLVRYRVGNSGVPAAPGDFPVAANHFDGSYRNDLRISGYSNSQNKNALRVVFYFAIDNPLYDFSAAPSAPQNRGLCHKILGPYSHGWLVVPIVEYDALGGRYYTGLRALRR